MQWSESVNNGPSGSRTYPTCKRRIGPQAVETGDGILIRIEQKPVHSVLDQLAISAVAARDDRKCTSHCFHHHATGGFAPGRMRSIDERVERLQENRRRDLADRQHLDSIVMSEAPGKLCRAHQSNPHSTGNQVAIEANVVRIMLEVLIAA